MKCWLYQIETIDTEQTYTGITTKANPFQRFQEHLTDLKNGKHSSPEFQRVWDNNPTICNLQFRCVMHCESTPVAEYNEAKVVSETWPPHRLNGTVPVAGGSLIFAIEQLEQQGYSNRAIAEKLGISQGYASKLRKRLRDSELFA